MSIRISNYNLWEGFQPVECIQAIYTSIEDNKIKQKFRIDLVGHEVSRGYLVCLACAGELFYAHASHNNVAHYWLWKCPNISRFSYAPTDTSFETEMKQRVRDTVTGASEQFTAQVRWFCFHINENSKQ